VPHKAIQQDTITKIETNDACILDGVSQARSCLRLVQIDPNKTGADAVIRDSNVATKGSI
jgi:hypothetical protein